MDSKKWRYYHQTPAYLPRGPNPRSLRYSTSLARLTWDDSSGCCVREAHPGPRGCRSCRGAWRLARSIQGEPASTTSLPSSLQPYPTMWYILTHRCTRWSLTALNSSSDRRRDLQLPLGSPEARDRYSPGKVRRYTEDNCYHQTALYIILILYYHSLALAAPLRPFSILPHPASQSPPAPTSPSSCPSPNSYPPDAPNPTSPSKPSPP